MLEEGIVWGCFLLELEAACFGKGVTASIARAALVLPTSHPPPAQAPFGKD